MHHPFKLVCSVNISLEDQGKKLTETKIINFVLENWKDKRNGYRDGVYLVPIPISNLFKSNIIKLEEGDYLFGNFERRNSREEPRKRISVLRNLNSSHVLPLVEVDAVVYSREVLSESRENMDVTADYEIIALIKKVVHGEQPMPPDTLLYNFFKASGGTDMKISDGVFIAKLKESFEFWKDKAIIY